jgi:hypothetical protein
VGDLLGLVGTVMSETYNDLKKRSDWMKLFRRLLHYSGWWDGQNELFVSFAAAAIFNWEIENGVTLLLQGLSPIRFAFLDGQARLTSLHYYIQGKIPDREIVRDMFFVNGTMKHDSSINVYDSWLLSRTGHPATVCIYEDNTMDSTSNQPLSNAFLKKLCKISKDQMSYLLNEKRRFAHYTESTLTDCLRNLIESNGVSTLEMSYWISSGWLSLLSRTIIL